MSNAELLERFLPGYRLVCRITARYLGLDLTDIVSKAFVLFALLKSAQYLWSALSVGFLTSSIHVPDGDLQRDVLKWVERRFEVTGGRAEVAVATPDDEKGSGPVPFVRKISYELAFDCTMYFFSGYHLIALRRQRGKVGGGDTILLTCIGLTTEPLREFLRECVKSAAGMRYVKPTRKQSELSKPEEFKQKYDI